MYPKNDVVVIGAGVVGLATAYRLLERNPRLELTLVEKETEVARHQSGHNSGVIHSGIYYRPGSLKAQNCVRGYRMLLEFLRAEGIEHEICGKIIVATDPRELPTLKMLERRAAENGLAGVRRLGSVEEIREVEPHANGIEALFVPQAGIVDYRRVCAALRRCVERRGGRVLLGAHVAKIETTSSQVEVVTQSVTVTARFAIACAGLFSDRLARSAEPSLPIRIVPFRGEYYKLGPHAAHLVRNLIYPVPNPEFPFLGVHFTRTAWGDVDVGPNAVLALKREGYRRADVNLRDLFEIVTWPGVPRLVARHFRYGMAELVRSWSRRKLVEALKRLVPEVRDEDLERAGSGVRAQACHRDGTLLDDFDVREFPRALHVCNAPSPAATSALAIGETLAERTTARLAELQ